MFMQVGGSLSLRGASVGQGMLGLGEGRRRDELLR